MVESEFFIDQPVRQTEGHAYKKRGRQMLCCTRTLPQTLLKSTSTLEVRLRKYKRLNHTKN